jgi:hypothetical protein
MGATGLEPVTPSVSSKGTRGASLGTKEVAPSPSFRCTSGCTNNPQTAVEGDLEALAAALLALSPADCARLAALLAGQQSPPAGRAEKPMGTADNC